MLKEGLHGQLDSMQEFFDRSTRALAEEDSGFAPQAGLRTVAQTVAHTAQTVEWFIDGAFASEGFDMDFERMEQDVLAATSLKAARAWMDRACAKAKQAVDSHTDEDWTSPLPTGPIMGGMPRFTIFGALTDHTAHHRGALSVYTRLLGKVPPMPYVEM